MSKTLPFTGSGVAIITPFDGLKTNYDELGKLIEYHIENNTDAIIICGTTGEASTMPDEEHLAAIKYTVEKAAGRITVIAGTGSNDTAHAIELSKKAEEYGVDGIFLCLTYIPPFRNYICHLNSSFPFSFIYASNDFKSLFITNFSGNEISLSIPSALL